MYAAVDCSVIALPMISSLCSRQPITHTHTHTFNGPFSGTTQVSRYEKGKPIWILLKQETVSGSGISWVICKSAPRSRQITMPAPHHSVFLQARCPSCRPTNSVKALKAAYHCAYFWHWFILNIACVCVCVKAGNVGYHHYLDV